MVSQRVRDHMVGLGVHPHILDVARNVYPTWVAANGHLHDRGVNNLAREIGQLIAVLEAVEEEEGADALRHWYAQGGGLLVVRGLGIEGYSVAVIAGEAYDIDIKHGGSR